MRARALLLALLVAVAVAGDEKTTLQQAIEKLRVANPDRRDAASVEVVEEARKLLAPLLQALEDRDPEVRRRARSALESLVPSEVVLPDRPKRTSGWHPWQATGAPNAIANSDHPNAWASRTGDMGVQWLELGYRQPRRVDTIRIFEVNSAGALIEVETVDEKGVRRSVWKGNDPTKRPGVFELKIKPTAYRVKLVRLVIDTNRARGWNEIDAVEIVGPDGRAWADTATASSTYAR